MSATVEIVEVLPGVFRWAEYSEEHKCELSSHAVRDRFGLWLFDPIPLSATILDWFPPVPPTGIVLTNANHARAAREWSHRFGLPIFGPPESAHSPIGFSSWIHPRFAESGWQIVPLPGGAPGETALRCADRSLIIFGDAVVNLPGRSLEVLPAKYCEDQATLITHLHQLAATSFENALFAHGTPLLSHASEQIRAMLTRP